MVESSDKTANSNSPATKLELVAIAQAIRETNLSLIRILLDTMAGKSDAKDGLQEFREKDHLLAKLMEELLKSAGRT